MTENPMFNETVIGVFDPLLHEMMMSLFVCISQKRNLLDGPPHKKNNQCSLCSKKLKIAGKREDSLKVIKWNIMKLLKAQFRKKNIWEENEEIREKGETTKLQ